MSCRHASDVRCKDRSWKDGSLTVRCSVILSFGTFGSALQSVRHTHRNRGRRRRVIHCHQQHIVASSFAAVVSHRATDARSAPTLVAASTSRHMSPPTRGFPGHLHISEYSRRVFGRRAADGQASSAATSTRPGSRQRRCLGTDGSCSSDASSRTKASAASFARCPPDYPRAVIGRAPDARYLAPISEQLAVGKVGELWHQIDDAGIVAAYRSAVCVVPPVSTTTCTGHHTNVPELLGQTLLEGMACGTPGVCTGRGESSRNRASQPDRLHRARARAESMGRR